MIRTGRIVNGVMVSLAAFGFLLPQPLVAGSPAPASPPSPVVDVALGEGGVLVGQVVDDQGAALANVPVSLKAQERELAVAKSSKEGYFKFKGVRGGVYHLAAAKGHGVFRMWSPGTAPPAAEEGALLVSGDQVVRGQEGNAYKAFLTNPLLIGAVVATAVAVPVAIHNSHHSSPSSP
jgi:hypothetical protein